MAHTQRTLIPIPFAEEISNPTLAWRFVPSFLTASSQFIGASAAGPKLKPPCFAALISILQMQEDLVQDSVEFHPHTINEPSVFVIHVIFSLALQ